MTNVGRAPLAAIPADCGPNQSADLAERKYIWREVAQCRGRRYVSTIQSRKTDGRPGDGTGVTGGITVGFAEEPAKMGHPDSNWFRGDEFCRHMLNARVMAGEVAARMVGSGSLMDGNSADESWCWTERECETARKEGSLGQDCLGTKGDGDLSSAA